MWGLNLDSWNNVLVLFLAIGALAAVIVGVSTYAAFQLQKQEADAANADLDRYKLTVAAHVADANREGIEAGKTAGGAILKAAEANEREMNLGVELEKQRRRTAEAEANLEKVRQKVADRTFTSQAEQQKIADALKLFAPQSVTMIASPATPESEGFVRTLAAALTMGNWTVRILPGTTQVRFIWPSGVVIQWSMDEKRPWNAQPERAKAAEALASELNSRGIEAHTNPGLLSSDITMDITISQK